MNRMCGRNGEEMNGIERKEIYGEEGKEGVEMKEIRGRKGK